MKIRGQVLSKLANIQKTCPQTCDVVSKFCILAILLVAAFSISLAEIFSTTLILVFLASCFIKRDVSFLNKIYFKILIVYILWVILSCINSSYPKESFRGVFKVLEYTALFAAVSILDFKEKFIKRFCLWTGIVIVIICVNGFVQRVTGTDLLRGRTLTSDDHLKRISSSLVHPNDFGVYLVVMSSLALSFLMQKGKDIWRTVSSSVVAIIALSALYFTGSRGAWFSFLFAFFVLGAMKSKKILILFFTVLVILLAILPGSIKDRIVDVADLSGGTSWERMMLWKGTGNMIKVHPFLGFGINTFSRNFPAFKPAEYPDLRYPHNSYLHMASEIGLVGLFFYLAFLLSVFIFCYQKIRVMKNSQRKILATGLLAGLVGFAINASVDTHLYSVTLSVFFHTMLGLCVALCSVSDEK